MSNPIITDYSSYFDICETLNKRLNLVPAIPVCDITYDILDVQDTRGYHQSIELSKFPINEDVWANNRFEKAIIPSKRSDIDDLMNTPTSRYIVSSIVVYDVYTRIEYHLSCSYVQIIFAMTIWVIPFYSWSVCGEIFR